MGTPLSTKKRVYLLNRNQRLNHSYKEKVRVAASFDSKLIRVIF